MKKIRRLTSRQQPRPTWRTRQRTNQAAPAPLPPLANWQGCAATLVGSRHLKQQPPQPCQDAALVVAGPRPLILVADGAGSAALSHHGSQALVCGVRRLLETLGDDYAAALDAPLPPSSDLLRKLALRPVKHGMGLLQDLAASLHHDTAMLRSTLIVAIGGRSRWLWIRIGDGALVIEQAGQLQLIGTAGKGEYANQTCFIDEQLQPQDVQFGVFDSAGLSGVAAMSDGAAERLVQLQSGAVASRLGEFMQQARAGQLGTLQLHQFFADAGVWQRTTGDDRALAVLASA